MAFFSCLNVKEGMDLLMTQGEELHENSMQVLTHPGYGRRST